jgi:hypothetical protein
MLPDSAKHRCGEQTARPRREDRHQQRATVLAAALIFFAWEHKHGGDDQGKNTWR